MCVIFFSQAVNPLCSVVSAFWQLVGFAAGNYRHLKPPLVRNVSMDYCFTPLDLLDLLRGQFCLSASPVLSPVLPGVRLTEREAL